MCGRCEPCVWTMVANMDLVHVAGEMKFPQGFSYAEGDLQDPEGRAHVKLRLPFVEVLEFLEQGHSACPKPLSRGRKL